MTESNNRLREYCVLIQKLKEALNNMDYLVLKLYRGYDGTRYEPQDIDIFIGSDLQKALQIIRSIMKHFPDSKAIRKGFLNPPSKVFINKHALEVDLYTEISYSPIFTLDRVPLNIRIMTIPWCKDINVSTLDRPTDTLYILIHALRHKRLYDYEMLSVVRELEDFDTMDLKKFVLYARKAGVERFVVILLWFTMYYLGFVLKIPITERPLFYRNALTVVKILIGESGSKGLAEYTAKLALRKASSRCVGLWLVFPFYVLNSIILALKNRSRRSLKVLLKVVSIYLLYEYVVGLLDKVGARGSNRLM